MGKESNISLPFNEQAKSLLLSKIKTHPDIYSAALGSLAGISILIPYNTLENFKNIIANDKTGKSSYSVVKSALEKDGIVSMVKRGVKPTGTKLGGRSFVRGGVMYETQDEGYFAKTTAVSVADTFLQTPLERSSTIASLTGQKVQFNKLQGNFIEKTSFLYKGAVAVFFKYNLYWLMFFGLDEKISNWIRKDKDKTSTMTAKELGIRSLILGWADTVLSVFFDTLRARKQNPEYENDSYRKIVKDIYNEGGIRGAINKLGRVAAPKLIQLVFASAAVISIKEAAKWVGLQNGNGHQKYSDKVNTDLPPKDDKKPIIANCISLETNATPHNQNKFASKIKPSDEGWFSGPNPYEEGIPFFQSMLDKPSKGKDR